MVETVRTCRLQKGDIFTYKYDSMKLHVLSYKKLKVGSYMVLYGVTVIVQYEPNPNRLNALCTQIVYKNKWFHKLLRLIGIKIKDYATFKVV
jgi:hypothetical protein